MELKEAPLRWDQVVESDEIHSAKTGKWYVVRATRPHQGGLVAVTIVGVGVKNMPAHETVLVRRGVTGQAVDTIITILGSG